MGVAARRYHVTLGGIMNRTLVCTTIATVLGLAACGTAAVPEATSSSSSASVPAVAARTGESTTTSTPAVSSPVSSSSSTTTTPTTTTLPSEEPATTTAAPVADESTRAKVAKLAQHYQDKYAEVITEIEATFGQSHETGEELIDSTIKGACTPDEGADSEALAMMILAPTLTKFGMDPLVFVADAKRLNEQVRALGVCPA